MTGRRPKRSDSAPMTGEKKNCMNAHMVASRPNHSAARAVSPCRKPSISLGSTGSTTPSDSTSSTTVMKMKTIAAWRGPRDAGVSPVSEAEERIPVVLVGHEHDERVARHLDLGRQRGGIDVRRGEMLRAHVHVHAG